MFFVKMTGVGQLLIITRYCCLKKTPKEPVKISLQRFICCSLVLFPEWGFCLLSVSVEYHVKPKHVTVENECQLVTLIGFGTYDQIKNRRQIFKSSVEMQNPIITIVTFYSDKPYNVNANISYVSFVSSIQLTAQRSC